MLKITQFLPAELVLCIYMVVIYRQTKSTSERWGKGL